ncbi:oxidoreductase [Paenibacillus sp. 1001270B_150601_E10]|uniref:oxidoreductase n=1 Tax=Paenibacillus sp. 1001270B_150601_E10 TaxID=2787079 RepID=UPI001E5C3993|nr:oxidoreductase [Paenibacillus sp. 1001270B_150601_E10]
MVTNENTPQEELTLPTSFQAFVLKQNAEGSIEAAVQTMTLDDLPEADVTIKVHYSSVNYKDALACSPGGNIVKQYPFVPGIDASGVVVHSKDERFQPGQAVLLTGYEFGVTHFGGFSEYIRVPGDWLLPIPKGLSKRDAMVFGTAGLTAALSVERLEKHGIAPSDGKILVTGASGGVGSLAVAMLSTLGYSVTAATGKKDAEAMLLALGAKEVISRESWLPDRPRSLDRQKWTAAVDVCGGDILAAVLASLRYGGAVAASGMTNGGTLPTTVYPFILRGITLYGVDSVYAPQETRMQIWTRMARQWTEIVQLDGFVHTYSLSDIPALTSGMLQGQSFGRAIIKY